MARVVDAQARGELRDQNSRLSYCVQVMHLMAACAEGPAEPLARKLRGVFSLHNLARVLCADPVDDLVKNAVLHMVTSFCTGL